MFSLFLQAFFFTGGRVRSEEDEARKEVTAPPSPSPCSCVCATVLNVSFAGGFFEDVCGPAWRRRLPPACCELASPAGADLRARSCETEGGGAVSTLSAKGVRGASHQNALL